MSRKLTIVLVFVLLVIGGSSWLTSPTGPKQNIHSASPLKATGTPVFVRSWNLSWTWMSQSRLSSFRFHRNQKTALSPSHQSLVKLLRLPESQVTPTTTTTSTVPPTPSTPSTTTTVPSVASVAHAAVTGTAAAPTASTGTQSVDLLLTQAPSWVQQVFHCIAFNANGHGESGGNPTIVNPSSGAGGLYQFLPSSWIGYGGGQFASLPEDAPVWAQDTVAYWAWQQSGFNPWQGDNSCWE